MSERSIDQALIKQVLNGDNESFDILVKKYEKRLQQAINNYVHDPAESKDIAQDTFIRAYNALSDFRGESVFYTWIYRIAINGAKNFLRNRERRIYTIDTSMLDFDEIKVRMQDDETPEYLTMCDEMRREVVKAFAELPDNLRSSMVLRELGGMSYEEIAQTLNCPIGTVRSRIFRARNCIDQQIKPFSNK